MCDLAEAFDIETVGWVPSPSESIYLGRYDDASLFTIADLLCVEHEDGCYPELDQLQQAYADSEWILVRFENGLYATTETEKTAVPLQFWYERKNRLTSIKYAEGCLNTVFCSYYLEDEFSNVEYGDYVRMLDAAAKVAQREDRVLMDKSWDGWAVTPDGELWLWADKPGWEPEDDEWSVVDCVAACWAVENNMLTLKAANTRLPAYVT